MNRISPEALEVFRVLRKHDVRFIVIGGYAAILLGSPVLTGDVDICYRREDENLKRLAAALRELKAALRGAPPDVPFQMDAAALKAGDHFTFDTIAGPLDCLGTPTGTEGYRDLDQSAVEVDMGGPSLQVASIEDLLRMKTAAGRPKDLIAVEWLRALRDEIEKRNSER
jgi:hypothetical protein